MSLPHKQLYELHRQERLFKLSERHQAYTWMPKATGSYVTICSQISSRTIVDLPEAENLVSVKYTGMRWSVDESLIAFFRKLMYDVIPRSKSLNTGNSSKISSSSAASRSMSARQAPGRKAMKRQLLRQYSVSSPPPYSTVQATTPANEAAATAETPRSRARARWKKGVRLVIKYISESKIPEGSKGDICRAVQRDVDFGQLFLSGPNPTLIRRCTRIPENFPVTDEQLSGLLERSKKIASEAEVSIKQIASEAEVSSKQIASEAEVSSKQIANEAEVSSGCNRVFSL